MKKVLLLIISLFFMCSCGKESSENVLKDINDKISNIKSYKLTGNMEIRNDEEAFTYSLESYYLKDNYYKVILVNQTNNHEQIILKNKEDIYVITPTLNKSFKFQSEWPNNSSQAYLLGNILNDINNDKNAEVIKENDTYIIKSGVNYPNNEELIYQKVYLNSKKDIEKVEVYDDNDILKIKVDFENIDYNARLKEKDFQLNEYIKEETDKEDGNENSEQNNVESNDSQNENGETNEDNTNTSQETADIDNIIYPLYIPSNTYLASSETIENNNGNRVILTFAGEKNFVLIEETTSSYSEMEIIPVYGEPLMLSESIGALGANSLSWDRNNVSYYLASTELTVNEMQLIANSLGNTNLVANTK